MTGADPATVPEAWSPVFTSVPAAKSKTDVTW